MTLRSRLSAAWRADTPFMWGFWDGLSLGYVRRGIARGLHWTADRLAPKDDFPPMRNPFDGTGLIRHPADPTQPLQAISFGGCVCKAKAGYPSFMHDLRCPVYRPLRAEPDVDMSPHPPPSMADECEAMRAAQERDIANVEVPAVIRKRKKLVAVPKE